MDKHKINQTITLLFVFLIFLIPCLKAQVVINEIGWMGTQHSANDEWIELYNNSSSAIDLSGWQLKSTDENPSITLDGTINSHRYYLLERTSDNTISDISADKIYTGALNNTGENISLIDNKSNTIDQVNCSAGWFAGKNSDKTSMERIDPYTNGSSSNNWGNNNRSTINGHDASDNTIYGTPRHKNSIMDQSLPVLITSFQARLKNDNIIINWYCHYTDVIILFNLYGSHNNIDYTKISEIPVEYNKNNYQCIDKEIKENGTYFYKLEIIENNGSKKYYGPIDIVIEKNNAENNQSTLNIFPNPFNPATTFCFNILEQDWSSNISFKIFNCLGRHITTLTRKISSPGQFKITWNGCDAKGVSVPSGIYFVKLFAADRILASSRMLKLK